MDTGEGRLRRSSLWLGVFIAASAALYHLILASEPLNDQFMSVVWGRELLFGHLPVRDFFEAGEPLTELLSAAAGALVGYRLLSEALVVALGMGLGTWAVFWVTRELTQSTWPAGLAAVLVTIAGGRSYSYPKIVIYAVGAVLIWRYIQQQSRSRLAALACWTGAAFLWRHDHGAYLALATVFTVSLAHGLTRSTMTRLVQAGALALAVAAPYLAWVQFNRGIVPYVIDGRSVVASELSDHGPFHLPAWPIRRMADVVQVQPQAAYAPPVDIKWADASTSDERDAVLKRFHLISDRGISRPGSIRLLDPNPNNIRALVNHPIVEDTSGIDRRTSSVPLASWSIFDRIRFRLPWLRINPFPVFDDPEVAAIGAAWLFVGLCLGALAWAARPSLGQDAPALERRKAIIALAGLSIVSLPGLLREPLSVYAPDVVVLPAIFAGWISWELWGATSSRIPALRWVTRPAVIVLCVLLAFSTSGAGRLRERVSWLSGNWMSFARADATWMGAWQRLVASPPVAFWQGEQAPTTVVLARYVRACTTADAPLLVISLSPDLQYYADRPLASRHFLLGSGRWTSETDQEMSIAKLRKAPPPIVIAQEPFYSTTFSVEYPRIAEYVRGEYAVAGRLPDQKGRAYVILSRTGLTPITTEPRFGWPCFVEPATVASL
jgi:hypothetical protein